jgi:hypothetical protein
LTVRFSFAAIAQNATIHGMDGANNQPPAPWKVPADNSEDMSFVAAENQSQPLGGEELVEWTASEFIAHNHSFEWYAGLAGSSVLLVLLVFLFTRDPISTIGVAIVCIFAAVLSAKRPNTLPYRLDHKGLTIGHRFYAYTSFRSYYVIHEGAITNVTLRPAGRSLSELSLYCPPEDEDRILRAIGSHLPMEQANDSVFDRFARRVHF